MKGLHLRIQTLEYGIVLPVSYEFVDYLINSKRVGPYCYAYTVYERAIRYYAIPPFHWILKFIQWIRHKRWQFYCKAEWYGFIEVNSGDLFSNGKWRIWKEIRRRYVDK